MRWAQSWSLQVVCVFLYPKSAHGGVMGERISVEQNIEQSIKFKIFILLIPVVAFTIWFFIMGPELSGLNADTEGIAVGRKRKKT